MTARGKVYRRCSCRDEGGKEFGGRCPKLKSDARHGSWTLAVELPPHSDGKRRQVKRGGFATKNAAATELNKLLSTEGRGVDAVQASRLTVAEYLTSWLAGKLSLRPTTARGYAGHVAYLIPRIGHHRLSDPNPRVVL
jgi:hypothetical protein